jgi:hypothetical protein
MLYDSGGGEPVWNESMFFAFVSDAGHVSVIPTRDMDKRKCFNRHYMGDFEFPSGNVGLGGATARRITEKVY